MARNNNEDYLNELEANEARVQELKRELRQCESKNKLRCFHTAYSRASLVPLRNPEVMTHMTQEEKLKYPPNTVVCTRCKELIDPSIFTDEQLHDAAFRLRSALAQIQIIVGARLDDTEKSELSKAFSNLDYVTTLLSGFYTDMTKRMADKGKRPHKGQKKSKGGIGLSGQMLR